MKKFSILLFIFGFYLSAAEPKSEVLVWTEEKKALAEFPNFKYVGEYTGKFDDKEVGVQVNALKDEQFLVAVYQGGLPGDKWDKSKINSKILKLEEVKNMLDKLTKVARVSPTIGAKAPEDAFLLFPDGFTNVKDGFLHPGGETTKEVSSFKMHLEFLVPFKPAKNPSNQDRGNSGIYIFNNYEIQIIDSFALDFVSENNPFKLESLNTQWCGCLYKTKVADVNMAFPPLSWQTYDIEFIAPVFEGEKKVKNARLTVLHNGVKIHDDYELLKGTGNGANRPQLAKGIIYFQNHANPALFRNVWIVEKK